MTNYKSSTHNYEPNQLVLVKFHLKKKTKLPNQQQNIEALTKYSSFQKLAT